MAREVEAFHEDVPGDVLHIQPMVLSGGVGTLRGYVRGPDDPSSPFYKGYFSVGLGCPGGGAGGV